MKTHIIYLTIVAILLSSCGTFKKVNRTKVEETVKTDSTAQIKEKEATKTKVTEVADTTVRKTSKSAS